MSDDKKITAFVGQPVQITLQSMASSTGYSWFLTTLDGGLALSGSSAAPTGPGVAPINQTIEVSSPSAPRRLTLVITPTRPANQA